jgi:hypothetical protein
MTCGAAGIGSHCSSQVTVVRLLKVYGPEKKLHISAGRPGSYYPGMGVAKSAKTFLHFYNNSTLS